VDEAATFQFIDPGILADGELSLSLIQRRPANPARGTVPSYEFEMRRMGVKPTVGHISFRAGTTRDVEMYSGHIGYSVEPAHRGRHFAERAGRLLFPLMRRHGFERIWITCNPDNTASRRTCERLGGALIDVVALPRDNDMYLRGERAKCRYLLTL
jgi:tagatose 1,6-diphosphate aldolase